MIYSINFICRYIKILCCNTQLYMIVLQCTKLYIIKRYIKGHLNANGENSCWIMKCYAFACDRDQMAVNLRSTSSSA